MIFYSYVSLPDGIYTYTTLGQADINDDQCGTSTIEVDDFPETRGVFPHGQLTVQQKILQLIPGNHVTPAVLLLVKHVSCHCARFLAIIHVYLFKNGHVLRHWRCLKSSLQVQKPPGYRYQQAPFLCLKSFLEALGLPLSSSLCLLKILVITPKNRRQYCWCYIAKKSPNLRLTFEAPHVPYSSSADYSHTGFGYKKNCSCFGSCLARPSVHGLGSIVTRFRAGRVTRSTRLTFDSLGGLNLTSLESPRYAQRCAIFSGVMLQHSKALGVSWPWNAALVQSLPSQRQCRRWSRNMVS